MATQYGVTLIESQQGKTDIIWSMKPGIMNEAI